MPYGSVRLVPGVDVQRTPTLLEAGISSSQLIRFKDSLAQKYGGWTKYYPFAVDGVPRELHGWEDLKSIPHLGVGSTTQLAIVTEGALTDITPQTKTTNPGLAENDAYTKILLHFDGSDTSTTITDDNYGGSAHSWSAAGNAQLDTAQKEFGTASLLCDGTGDYVTTADSADFTLGAGVWTVDCWFNCTVASGVQAILCGQADSSATTTTVSFWIERSTTDVIRGFAAVGGSATVVAGTTQFTDVTNTGWHHVALVRVTGDILRLFIDGVQEGGDVTLSGTVNDSSNAFSVGRLGELVAGTWGGWIDEFRLSVGVSRWTANFTPPTAAYAAIDFSTTSGSTEVTIVDAGISNVTVFDSIYLNTPVSIGGLILSGLYQIDTIVGATSYKINAATAATATETNAGTVPLFTTTSGSSTVQVTLADHGVSGGSGHVVVFPIETAGNGVTIDGGYTVVSVVDVDNFTITASTQATATGAFAMNTGAAQILYYIALGPPALGSGYGTGGYGEGGYGTGTTSSAQTGTPITATDWTSDNWGEIWLTCPEGGGVYQYEPDGGFVNAQLVATAPPFNGGIFLSVAQQILICWGSTVTRRIGTEQDPMLVKWSDVGLFTDFVATATNQAREFRIPIGSMIRGGMAVANQDLIWTDLDLWAMNYQGPPFVFGFNKVGAGAGLISSHAAQQLRGGVFWMGPSNIYSYSARGVTVVPCPIWDFIYQNINMDYAANVRALPNTPFNEAGWAFPSTASVDGENDSYFKFNILEPGTPWDYGTLSRSAWMDQTVLGAPLGASPTGIIYQHETTNDADGAPLGWSFQTGYFYIAEGEDFAFVDQILPDFKYGTFGGAQSAQIQITVYTINNTNDTPIAYGPYLATSTSTSPISVRLRARQMAFKFSGNDLGSFMRIGKVRYRWAPAGRR